MQRIVKAVIPSGLPKQSLLQYLSTRFTYHSPELWGELVSERRILINGEFASCDAILAGGEEMEYRPRPLPEPPVDWEVGVIHEDEDFLVLDKPGNLPCHPAGCYFNNTLWAALKEGRIGQLPPLDDVHFINRLDRETSGLVLLAKHPKAARRGASLLQQSNSCKIYQVLVEGVFPESLDACGWLYHDPAALVNKRRSFAYEKPSALAAENAETHFRLLRQLPGRSLVEATLGTGRLHQIRATLRSLGYPVVGDKLYGPDETIFLRFISHTMTPDDIRMLDWPRQALHAWMLRFGNYVFTSRLSLC